MDQNPYQSPKQFSLQAAFAVLTACGICFACYPLLLFIMIGWLPVRVAIWALYSKWFPAACGWLLVLAGWIMLGDELFTTGTIGFEEAAQAGFLIGVTTLLPTPGRLIAGFMARWPATHY